MTLTLTPPTRAAYTTTPVTLLHDHGEDIGDMEAVDARILGHRLEQIDIGGGGLLGTSYLRITGPDLITALQALKALCDDAITAVDEARDEHRAEFRRPCWCGTPVDPDDLDCGAPECRSTTTLDWKGLVP